MRCSCGAEIRDGDRFCGKCGEMAPDSSGRRCAACGAALNPGARFCGKCGAPLTPAAFSVKASVCHVCGAALYPGAKFCGRCRAPVSAESTKVLDGNARETVGNAIQSLREKTRPARDWVGSKIVNKERARKILIIVLIVGLCLILAGIGGRISMGRVTSVLGQSGFFSGLGSDLDGVLNRSAGRIISGLMISLIKNDSSGFVSMINQLTKMAGSMAGDPYGMSGFGTMLAGPVAEEAFAEARAQAMQEAGAYWPLLLVMAYSHELLVIGFIAAIAAAVLWFLLDGQLSDIRELRLEPALYIGAGWAALVVILTIIALAVIRV